MALERSGERLTYEQALRVIGRHLDAEPAHDISVTEVADGFTVRSHSSGDRADARTVHFTRDRLRDLVIFQASGRGSPRRHHRHQGIWTNFPHGHEDFFRALGHALDRERARSVSVEEQPDGIAVTYVAADPENPPHSRDVRTVMRENEIQNLLNAAQRRRGSGLYIVSDRTHAE